MKSATFSDEDKWNLEVFLRDLFAAIVLWRMAGTENPGAIADLAYTTADALIERRKQ